MENKKKIIFGAIAVLVIIVGLGIIWFLNVINIPSSEGHVIVKNLGGGQLMKIAECADHSYVENTSDYIIEGKIISTETKLVKNKDSEGVQIKTYSEFRINNYLKGEPLKYDMIQIVTDGGCVAGMCQSGEESPIMDTGEKRLYLTETNGELSIHGCGGIKTLEPIKKSDLGKKINVLFSGNYGEKLDILFIPQNISDTTLLKQTIEKILFNEKGAPEGAGLFNTDPFIKYKDKFNVSYIDKNLDANYFNCILEQQEPDKPPKWQLFQHCDNNKIEEEYKIFNPNYIIVIFDLPLGYSSTGGDIQFLDIDSQRFAWTFVHEFAHQFGGLADEYSSTESPGRNCGGWGKDTISIRGADYNCFESYAKAISIYPNLDTLGCPKWCNSYDSNKLIEENRVCSDITDEQECASKNGGGICTWFKTKHPLLNSNCVRTQGFENIGINCIENSQCIFGGDYGQLAFNPGISIMSGGEEFNKPSEDHLATVLQCCYPRNNSNSCNTFRNKFISSPIDVNYFYKIAYKKIVDCE